MTLQLSSRGNLALFQHADTVTGACYSKTYTVRFSCVAQRETVDSDDEENDDLPRLAYARSKPFAAMMKVVAGPAANNKRHVRLSLWLIPNQQELRLAKAYAGMAIEEGSDIVVERGVISSFQTNEINVPCCATGSCSRRSVLFPALTIFVEWMPGGNCLKYIIEPAQPVAAMYISDVDGGDCGEVLKATCDRANAIVDNYYPGPPVDTHKHDDEARKSRITKRKAELAELRAQEARNSAKVPCPNGAVDDDDDSEMAETIQRSLAEAASPQALPVQPQASNLTGVLSAAAVASALAATEASSSEDENDDPVPEPSDDDDDHDSEPGVPFG